jgi:hypothetical protein
MMGLHNKTEIIEDVGPHISIARPSYWCHLAAVCEGSGLYCVLLQLTFLDGKHTYAGDNSYILPDIGAANIQQHTIKICNHPTNSEITGRSQTAGTPCATVEMLAYNRHLSAVTVILKQSSIPVAAGRSLAFLNV